jgi:hypothetical protein
MPLLTSASKYDESHTRREVAERPVARRQQKYSVRISRLRVGEARELRHRCYCPLDIAVELELRHDENEPLFSEKT